MDRLCITAASQTALLAVSPAKQSSMKALTQVAIQWMFSSNGCFQVVPAL